MDVVEILRLVRCHLSRIIVVARACRDGVGAACARRRLMWLCWHTQLRLVHEKFPSVQLRAISNTQAHIVRGQVFVYVSPTVRRRETVCPAHVVQTFRDLECTIIHVEEPQ
jgi:hypothetical protein